MKFVRRSRKLYLRNDSIFSLPKHAQGNSGLSCCSLQNAITEALTLADNKIDFTQFDANNDSMIDMITIVHRYLYTHVGYFFMPFIDSYLCMLSTHPCIFSATASYYTADMKMKKNITYYILIVFLCSSETLSMFAVTFLTHNNGYGEEHYILQSDCFYAVANLSACLLPPPSYITAGTVPRLEVTTIRTASGRTSIPYPMAL